MSAVEWSSYLSRKTNLSGVTVRVRVRFWWLFLAKSYHHQAGLKDSISGRGIALVLEGYVFHFSDLTRIDKIVCLWKLAACISSVNISQVTERCPKERRNTAGGEGAQKELLGRRLSQHVQDQAGLGESRGNRAGDWGCQAEINCLCLCAWGTERKYLSEERVPVIERVDGLEQKWAGGSCAVSVNMELSVFIIESASLPAPEYLE